MASFRQPDPGLPSPVDVNDALETRGVIEVRAPFGCRQSELKVAALCEHSGLKEADLAGVNALAQ